MGFSVRLLFVLCIVFFSSFCYADTGRPKPGSFQCAEELDPNLCAKEPTGCGAACTAKRPNGQGLCIKKGGSQIACVCYYVCPPPPPSF